MRNKMSEKVDNAVRTITGFFAIALVVFCVVFTETILITEVVNGSQDRQNTTQVSEVQRTN